MEELIERQTIKSEKDLQKQVFAYLNQRGIVFGHARMDKRTTNRVGQLDFWLCAPPRGRYVEFECKIEGQNPTPEQAERILAIKMAGGIALVVYSLNAVKATLDDLMR